MSNICPITFVEITEETVTACGHHFEKSALDDWLTRSETCPVCRAAVEIISTTYLPLDQGKRFQRLCTLVSTIPCADAEDREAQATLQQKINQVGKVSFTTKELKQFRLKMMGMLDVSEQNRFYQMNRTLQIAVRGY